MWHASIALLTAAGPKFLSSWNRRDEDMAQKEIKRLLAGVGHGEPIVERGTLALHVRKKVSTAELAVVGPATDVRTGVRT